jgi:hypothetical protein
VVKRESTQINSGYHQTSLLNDDLKKEKWTRIKLNNTNYNSQNNVMVQEMKEYN